MQSLNPEWRSCNRAQAPRGAVVRVCNRSRPWLGTYVEVSLEAQAPEADDAQLLAAVERAYAEIARIHDLMSYQDERSELSQLNRLAPGEWFAISPDTEAVLRFSLELWSLSEGR